jgi:ABC-type uncharacterized transport system substrate-binding protein
MMNRRVFIARLAATVASAPVAARAQKPAKIPRVGFIEAGTASVNGHFLEAFRQGLRELGYVEGQSIAIKDRWAEGHSERFPEIVADLIGLPADVIVAASTAGALAAKEATASVPIVFVGVSDPVGVGLVASLARPGGNLTGLSRGTEEGLSGKAVQLLKEAVPKASRVAVLFNPGMPGLDAHLKETRTAARALGMKAEPFEVRDLGSLDAAFAGMRRARVGALIVLTDPLTLRHRAPIVELAAKSRLPAVYSFSEFARGGGLMAYGASVPAMFRRAAVYVDKILKGAKPADLPVERPTKFELIMNMKTAKRLGLTIPPSLMLRADEVIE